MLLGVAMVAVLAGPANADPVADPADDFLAECVPGAAPQAGVEAMDLRSAEAAVDEDGTLRLTVETGGDALAYLASNPPSAAFAFEVEDTPRKRRVSVVHEIHEGQARSEVHLDGRLLDAVLDVQPDRKNGTVFLVDVDARDLDLAWFRVTAFNMPEGGEYVCDVLGSDTSPLPVDVAEQAPTTTSAPTTVAPATTAPSASTSASTVGVTTQPGAGDGGPDSGLFGLSWWALLLCVAVAVLGLGGLWWWFQRVRSGGARAADSLDRLFGERPPEGGTSHPAPRDPPEGGGDFGR